MVRGACNDVYTYIIYIIEIVRVLLSSSIGSSSSGSSSSSGHYTILIESRIHTSYYIHRYINICVMSF